MRQCWNFFFSVHSIFSFTNRIIFIKGKFKIFLSLQLSFILSSEWNLSWLKFTIWGVRASDLRMIKENSCLLKMTLELILLLVFLDSPIIKSKIFLSGKCFSSARKPRYRRNAGGEIAPTFLIWSPTLYIS